ncbi:oligogalacturonide transporter [Sphingomonas jinjuensis]|uniref:Oligogalacturonide transporter n=1 Tax=Sphingomonas jinjuensis TaxID=535907 RepID=A0A840FCC6_9SPHN|nr:MFS transporter [Sphingomonas jinjuensis]MBB4154371.1 oligogalacturonide transporter [Sphingomonas jinjuensis]
MATDPIAANPAMPVHPTRPVRWYNLIAYGSNDVLGAGSMAVISTWILIFYTSFCGLSAAQATIIFGVARVLDAFTSPIIGHLSDSIGRSAIGRRFGRRRVFILAAIPLLPSFAIMWVAGQSFWYYLVTYVLFEMVYAMEIIPYETLASEMATDYRTKAKFAGARILCGQLSAIAAAFLPGWLIARLGPDSPDTYLYMGIIFSVMFMGAAGLLYAFSWERQRPPGLDDEEAARDRPTLGAAFKALYRNLFSTLGIRAFRLHLGMYLGGYISQDIYNAAFTYFVIFALAGTTGIVANLVGVTYIVQLIAVVLAINFALRLSPAAAYRFAALSFGIGVIVFLAMYAAGYTATSALFWLPVVFAGLGRGALNYIPWATYNYMADVDEIVTGRRREGAFAGVMTFVRKMSQALAIILVGQVMQASGFVSKATVQSPTAIAAIVIVLGAGTLAMLVFGVLVSTRFRLTPATHAILLDEIERFRAGERTPSDRAHAEVVEDLSGWRYDQLWGRNPVAR